MNHPSVLKQMLKPAVKNVSNPQVRIKHYLVLQKNLKNKVAVKKRSQNQKKKKREKMVKKEVKVVRKKVQRHIGCLFLVTSILII